MDDAYSDQLAQCLDQLEPLEFVDALSSQIRALYVRERERLWRMYVGARARLGPGQYSAALRCGWGYTAGDLARLRKVVEVMRLLQIAPAPLLMEEIARGAVPPLRGHDLPDEIIYKQKLYENELMDQMGLKPQERERLRAELGSYERTQALDRLNRYDFEERLSLSVAAETAETANADVILAAAADAGLRRGLAE